jgi:hypothetical protein
MGVEYLSFPASSVDPKTFKEITSWISGPKFGVEMGSTDQESIPFYNSDFIVIPVHLLKNDIDSQSLVIQIKPNDLPSCWESLVLHKSKILFLEFISEDFPLIRQDIAGATDDFKIFIKITGTLDDYLQWPIDGISLDGNPELRPGLKEYPISEILEKLEAED